MEWKRPPPTQFGLANLLLLTGMAGLFFGITINAGLLLALLAVGMPVFGRLVIEFGIRVSSNQTSENCIRTGSAILGCWFFIAIPVCVAVIVSFAVRLSE